MIPIGEEMAMQTMSNKEITKTSYQATAAEFATKWLILLL